MKNADKIENILVRMIELLRVGERHDWADAFEKLREQIATEPVDVILKIRNSYGGMGSLNDIVLHKNGRPLVAENNEFDHLNTELYNLCHDVAKN